jgi:hypothetical protein
VSLVARHQRVETTRHRRVTGHDAFRKKPLGMMSFDEEGAFAISAPRAYRAAELKIASELYLR